GVGEFLEIVQNDVDYAFEIDKHGDEKVCDEAFVDDIDVVLQDWLDEVDDKVKIV
ncbi:hypothetical protein KI387_026196, partial [Taxus chinensis]